MRILVLDDDPHRHAAFKVRFAGHDVTHVWTVDDACSALATSDAFDLVHLDHDLNDHKHESKTAGMYGSHELTGFDVARFIARSLAEQKRPNKIVVHSWNPPGARMMVDVLRDAGLSTTYEPFQQAEDVTLDLVEWFEKEPPCVDGLPTSAALPIPSPDDEKGD